MSTNAIPQRGTTKVRYRTKAGEDRVYYYDYYTCAEDRALAALKKAPLRRVPKSFKWTAGQRGPVFQDATIVKLIKRGLVVCLGDFVELKGKAR